MLSWAHIYAPNFNFIHKQISMKLLGQITRHVKMLYVSYKLQYVDSLQLDGRKTYLTSCSGLTFNPVLSCAFTGAQPRLFVALWEDNSHSRSVPINQSMYQHCMYVFYRFMFRLLEWYYYRLWNNLCKSSVISVI